MIQDDRCTNCHKVLFRGSLKLLLGKKHGSEAFIEPKCERCGKVNHFSHDASKELRKTPPHQDSFFDSAR